MPRVPTVGLSPTSRPAFEAPGVVSFAGFSGVQEAAQTNETLGRIGRFASQIAQETQDSLDEARAYDAVNTFENTASKLYLEFKQKKGGAGVEAFKGYQKSLEEAMTGATGMLQNNQQRQLARNALSKAQSRFGLNGQEHYIEASAEYAQSVNLQGQMLMKDAMVANPDDPEFLINYARWENLVIKEAEALGYDEEQAQVFAIGKRDELIGLIVTNALDSEDPGRIKSAEAVMAALPDGLVSQTQQQSLTRLVGEKTLDSLARQEAAAHMSAGGSLASGLSAYFEMVKQDPKKAAIYLEQVTKLADLENKVQADKRGALRQRMEADMIKTGSYKATDLEEAEKLGLLADMKDYERRHKKGQNEDITSKAGGKIFAEFLSSPNLMRDRFDTWNELYDTHRQDIRQLDMERLALLWASSAPPEEEPPEILGPRALQQEKFTDQDRDKVRALLLKFDQQIKGAENDYLTRFQEKYGKDQATTITSRRSALEAEWISAVLDKYNELVGSKDWVSRYNDPSHEQALQIVAQIVWDGGWDNQEHTVNRFTTETSEIPSSPEDLEKYQEIAVAQIKTERLIEQYGDIAIGVPGFMVTAPEYQAELVEQVLGLTPEGAGLLAEVNREAALFEATNPISPAQIRRRAQGLFEEDRRRQISQDQYSQESAMQSAARDLLNSLNTVTRGGVSMHRGTKMNLEMYYKLFGEDTLVGGLFRNDRLRDSQKREMFLKYHDGENGVLQRLQSTGMSPEEAREFVLLFYVGEEKELDRRTQKRLQALPGDPNESRWKKLQRFFATGQFRVRDSEGRLNMDELYEMSLSRRKN